MVPKRQLPTGASGTRAAYRAPDSNLRCLLRVLGLTTPWAVPLLGFAALPAFVFSGWLLILTVAAVWLSYAVHETAHVIFSRRTGTRDGPTLLVRRGPTIRVVAATPSPRDRRRIAAAGPACGALAATALTAPGWMTNSPGAAATATAVAIAVHAYNLAPWTPDGGHIWGSQVDSRESLRRSRHRARTDVR